MADKLRLQLAGLRFTIRANVLFGLMVAAVLLRSRYAERIRSYKKELLVSEPQYEIPPRAVPENDAGYLEKITQAVFQAGFSWQVIRNKWPGFQHAFAEFDVDQVAAFTPVDVERLVEDKGIVRNGRKIEATITNARICQDLIAEHGSFYNYLRTMDGQPYAKREKQFCKKFKFMGPMGAYFFFWSVGEDVPEYHEWRAQNENK